MNFYSLKRHRVNSLASAFPLGKGLYGTTAGKGDFKASPPVGERFGERVPRASRQKILIFINFLFFFN
jgi:hypothetical protein